MSLPIISQSESQFVDLRPWILVRHISGTQAEVSLWSIDQIGMAFAIFSSAERADRYHDQVLLPSKQDEQTKRSDFMWRIVQPSEIELGKWMVAHYQAGVKWLVLDPSQQDAKRIFSMAEVLKGLRQRLTTATR